MIEWTQNPNKYLYIALIPDQPQTIVTQKDLDQTLGMKRNFLLNEREYKQNHLEKIINLSINENGFLRMAANKHTISIYKENNKFYFYDANYESGNAKVFSTGMEVIKEIERCLYTDLDKKPSELIKLDIVSFYNPKKKQLDEKAELELLKVFLEFENINLDQLSDERAKSALLYMNIKLGKHHNASLALPDTNPFLAVKGQASPFSLATTFPDDKMATEMINKHYHKDLGSTALFDAIQQGKIPLIDALITKGVDLLAVNENGENVLMVAVKIGIKETVDFLLSKGAAADMNDNDHKSPLYVALEKCNPLVAKRLLDEKVNVNLVLPNGVSCLHLAVTCIDPLLIKMLLAKGAAIESVTAAEKNTALHIAVEKSPLSIVVALLAAKNISSILNIPNARGETPVFLAAMLGKKDALNKLVEMKANINIPNKQGITPLEMAIKNNKLDAVKILIKNGANFLGNTPHHTSLLAYAIAEKKWDVVALILIQIDQTKYINMGEYKGDERLIMENRDEIIIGLKNQLAKVPGNEKEALFQDVFSRSNKSYVSILGQLFSEKNASFLPDKRKDLANVCVGEFQQEYLGMAKLKSKAVPIVDSIPVATYKKAF
jgi:ankyrin repeat protein